MPKARSKTWEKTEFDIAEDYLQQSVLVVAEKLQPLGKQACRERRSEIQKELRGTARQWKPALSNLYLGKKLDASVAQLAAKLGRRAFGDAEYDSRAVWLGAQAWSLTQAVVVHLKEDLKEGQSEVRNYIESRVIDICRNLDANGVRVRDITQALRSVLADCAGVLDQTISHAGAKETKQKLQAAIDICRHERTLARLASELYLAPEAPEARDNGVDVDRLWGVVHVMNLLCGKVFGLDEALCDCYAQTDSEDLLVVASSDQGFPGPPPDPFANRVVPRRHLLGGAAVATMSVIPNDRPDVYTNTNHQQEGLPDLTLAVPTKLANDQIGEIFVSLKTPRRSWAALEPALLCLVSIAKHVPGGRTAEPYDWISALSAACSPKEFDKRLRKEIAEAGGAPTTRLGIFIISAPADGEQPPSVRSVLDTWARTTALIKAKGEHVYKLPHESAYAFIRRNVADEEWESWRDGRELELVEAVRPDGKVAGSLAGWVVTWREDLRVAATEAIGLNELYELMRKQVRIGALETVSLNALRTNITHGTYGAAFGVALNLVKECGRECGVATNELIRMAIIAGHFRTAKRYCELRKGDAAWDIEGNLNRLLAAVALADLESAGEEITPCTRWLDANSRLADGPAEAPLVYPMVRFAGALVPWLRADAGPDPARAELTAAVQQIARRSRHYASVADGCLDVIERWRKAGPSEYAHVEEDVESALEAFLSATRTATGELEFWWELAALRRLIVVLRGYISRMKPPPRRQARRARR